MTPNELKEITDGSKIYFGYFPKEQYTPNISSGRFTELKYNNQPLFLGKSDVTQKVLSIRFNDTNDDFTNSCVVKLMNPTIDEATGTTTTRERTWFSLMEAQGFNFKNYIWRIWYKTGEELIPVYTGIIETISATINRITIRLNTRVSLLAKKSTNECRNNTAGWPTNARFETSLATILEGTKIDYTGDTQGIDYINTENEGDLDLIGFKDAGHISYYDEDIIFICKGRDSIKYNFITNTRVPFEFDDFICFHFIGNDDEHYFVTTKYDNRFDRAGEYNKLYLVKESDLSEIYLGVGRAPYVTTWDAAEEGYSAIPGFYCAKNGETVQAISGGSTYNDTAHFYIKETEYSDLISEVCKIDNYYAPTTNYRDAMNEEKTLSVSRGYWSFWLNGYLSLDNSSASAEVNTLAYDVYKGDNHNIKKSGSQKARAYFYYDTENDRLYFQRASNLYPDGGSEDPDTIYPGNYTKNWSNFGLNPIGFYNFGDGNLYYSDIKNNDFIEDWTFYNTKCYAITRTVTKIKDYKNELSFFTFYEIDKDGNKTSVSPLISGYDYYGISVFDYGGNTYYSFVYRDAFNNWRYYWKNSSGSSFRIPIGDNINYHSPISSNEVYGIIGLLIFYQGKLRRIEFDSALISIENTVDYIGETLDSSYGGYSIKNTTDDNYTALFFDNVVTAQTLPSFNVLDLSKLNKLQALILIIKAADKFAYIDEFDVLHIEDVANISYNGFVVDEYLDITKKDYEGFSTLSIDTYSYKPEDLFTWQLTGGKDWVGIVTGVWYGPDASFTVNLEVTGVNQITYSIISAAEILNVSEITVTDIDWSDITIKIPEADSYLELKFLDVDYSFLTNDPETDTKFSFVFNSRTLIENNAPVYATSGNNLDQSKDINNKFLDYNKAVFLKDAVLDWFLNSHNMYEVKVFGNYSTFNKGQKININAPKIGLFSKICYLKSQTIHTNNTSTLTLIEV